MADFTINEVSLQLGCTKNAIYKKKDYLIEHNLAYIDDSNLLKITVEGLNYLKEKRTKYIQLHNTTIENNTREAREEAENKQIKQVRSSINDSTIKLYERLIEDKEKQIEDKEKQIEYLKAQIREKDTLIATYFNSHLLGSGNTETNQEQTKSEDVEAEPKRKKFFGIF